MPVQTTAVPKQVEEAKKTNLKPNVNLPQTQTPPPAVRKKSAKSERASLLCSTPPTCIKDKDSHVEYTRREFLGEGGFARCYLVTNRQNRPFAAKVVAKASLKTPKAKGKLIGEIKVHQSLQHPNIVRYQECFEDKSNVYIVLELCENKSLLDMLRTRKRLTEPEVRFFILQILGATKYMHEKRVIHRDLKLGNLFLDSRMSVKLGDFGLAALLADDNERKRTICGTPNYIAPEVLCDNGGGHSYEVDLWSIGVIMYALLVGKPPFQAKDVKLIYKKIKDNQYDFPTSNPISPEAQDLITSLLCPSPSNRPSIDEISDHRFFHSGDMPREIPLSALHSPPQFSSLSKPISELNWRSVSIQAGLGKNVKVGAEAGKSVQACIATEHPIKGTVARLRAEDAGIAEVKNVLPMTLSPRVPAPAVGGLAEGRLMGKGAKRSVKRSQEEVEEDKENDVPVETTRKKGTIGRKMTRGAVQNAFPDIPEEMVEEPVKPQQPRRLAPPERKPSGGQIAATTTRATTTNPTKVSHAVLSRVPLPPDQNDPISSGAKRTLRGVKEMEMAKPPTQTEINVPSRVPARTQPQRSILKRTIAQDNLKLAAQIEDIPPPRSLRSRPPITTTNPLLFPESKIPIKTLSKSPSSIDTLINSLRTMGDNLTLALNTPPKRLSSQFHRAPVGLPTFVMRWVDYSGKYGLAYQLSNSLAGMFFNDSTSIILSPENTTFDYLSHVGEAISGSIGSHPPDLDKKIKLALRYKGYMADNLHGGDHQPSAKSSTNDAPKCFLNDFRRVQNAVLFRMSDNVFQMNFGDHSKVVLWDEARAIRYVDKRGEVHIWSLAEAMTKGVARGEVIERLKAAAKELLTWADLVEKGKRK